MHYITTGGRTRLMTPEEVEESNRPENIAARNAANEAAQERNRRYVAVEKDDCKRIELRGETLAFVLRRAADEIEAIIAERSTAFFHGLNYQDDNERGDHVVTIYHS